MRGPTTGPEGMGAPHRSRGPLRLRLNRPTTANADTPGRVPRVTSRPPATKTPPLFPDEDEDEIYSYGMSDDDLLGEYDYNGIDPLLLTPSRQNREPEVIEVMETNWGGGMTPRRWTQGPKGTWPTQPQLGPVRPTQPQLGPVRPTQPQLGPVRPTPTLMWELP